MFKRLVLPAAAILTALSLFPLNSNKIVPATGTTNTPNSSQNLSVNNTSIGGAQTDTSSSSSQNQNAGVTLAASTTQNATSTGSGDINGDGKVDILDLSTLLSNYKTTNATSDLNGDGIVNIYDLSLLLANYGKNVSGPTVTFTTPANNAVVSGMYSVAATATDATGVAGVQFKLDGNVVGTEDTTAPYGFDWDTTKVANGNHTLTATARNTGNLTTTATVTVNVQNVVTPPSSPNLITNPSLETANGSAPANFSADSWGNNVATFTYPVAGHTGNGAQVSYASYTSGANGGDAKYTTAAIPVTAGQTYQFTDYYKSDVTTQVDYFDGNGNWLGTMGQATASANWTQFKGTVIIPSGVTSVMIGHILSAKGTLTTDDYSLSSYTPLPFNRAIVSVTFDDSWANQYANAYPYMKNLGIPATYYVISGSLGQPGYMVAANVQDLYANGNEIGSHTVHHCDLTGVVTDDPTNCPTPISASQVQSELANSQTALNSLLGVQVVKNFAYPYGAYNASTISVASGLYTSQRTVVAGYNTKDSFNITQLKMYEVDSNITQAQVQAWINEAIAQKAWLILTYHEVATTPADPSDALYTTNPADFQAEMTYLKNSGVTIKTVQQALDEILPQL